MFIEFATSILVLYGFVWFFSSILCFFYRVETDKTYHHERDKEFYNRHLEDSLAVSLFWPYYIFKFLSNGLKRINQGNENES